jgi:hypothetical protein
MNSEVHSKNIVMATLVEVPKDAHKVFEEHQKVVQKHRKDAEAKELQEFLACLKKDRQDVVTHVKEIVLPLIDRHMCL